MSHGTHMLYAWVMSLLHRPDVSLIHTLVQHFDRERHTHCDRETDRHTMTERDTLWQRERYTHCDRHRHTHCDRERCAWSRKKKMHVTGIERHADEISRHMSCLDVNDSHLSVLRIWMRAIHMGDMTSHIHTCDVTDFFNGVMTWYELICVTWLIRVCDMTHSCVWHDSFICVTSLIHMCDMTHSYVWHDSFIRVTWLIYMCDTTHSYVWNDSFICVTRLIYICDTTHSYV